MKQKDQTRTSLPLTPNSIPIGKVNENQQFKESRQVYDPLRFIPQTPLTKFLMLPGILIFCIFSGFLVGKYGYSFLFLLPLAHIAYYYFTRRAKEYSRTLEALKRMENTKGALSEFETVEWVNHILKKIWDVSEQTMSSIIFNEVNNILKNKATKQGFSVRLAEITLGTRSPVVERIFFAEHTTDSIVMEFAVHFIPVQASDEVLSYFKKERSHWNTYIEMEVVLANFVTIPILVKNFTFSGLFKVTLDLSQKIPFVKTVSLSFVEMPLIDFQLVPLKAIDMLDLPYVGGLLNMIMESQIRKLLLQPEKITVNLEELVKCRGTVIGVVYVFVHDLQTSDQLTYWLSLKNNGKQFGLSEKMAGADPVFNQGFYDIIYDTSQFLEVTLFSSESQSVYGKISLRNLNKHIYPERLRLTGQNINRQLNVTTQFYPITEKIGNSAIISLNLISIEDLQATGAPINRLYSTYCIVSLETREAVVSRSVLKSIETKRIFVTKNPFYNETFKFFIRHFDDYVVKIRIMNEKEDVEIGKVIISCNDIKNNQSMKYRITGVEAGELNVKLNVQNIDMADPSITGDDVRPILQCKEDGESEKCERLTDSVETSNHLIDGLITDSSAGRTDSVETSNHLIDGLITDSSSGRTDPSSPFVVSDSLIGGHITGSPVLMQPVVEQKLPNLSLGIYCQAVPSQRFVNYKKACRISIKSFKSTGIFHLVFETDHVNAKMEPFSTEIPITRSVVIPIENERVIKVRLFMASMNGDALISEEFMDLNDRIVVFDMIRVEFDLEEAEFREFNDEADDENVKVIQVRIGEFNRSGLFTADFYNQPVKQNLKLVHHLTTHIVGSESLFCQIKDYGKTLSTVTLPKRNCDEIFNFGKSLTAPLFCRAQVCDFKNSPVNRKGELEVFVLKVSNLAEELDSQDLCYIKVFLNNEKIYKTQKKSKAQDPIFNESFKIKVNKETDKIGFHLFSANSLTVDSLLNYKDFSLLGLPSGYSRFMLPMNNGMNGDITRIEVHLILSYKPAKDKINW